MKKKVYISGAIAHYDLKERMATFDHAARYLSIKGYEPVNPFENGVSQDAHWMEHMRVDIALLLKCDCIYMLQGWELSKGAKLELDVASSCGIKVMFEGHENNVREYTCCLCGKLQIGYGNNPDVYKRQALDSLQGRPRMTAGKTAGVARLQWPESWNKRKRRA